MMWIRLFLIAVFLNVAVTSIVYGLKHPHKTQTEIFLHIPKSFIWNTTR